MKNLTVVLGVANAVAAGIIVYQSSSFGSTRVNVIQEGTTVAQAREVIKETAQLQNIRSIKKSESFKKEKRRQRLTSSFFLPILGERNSLTDMVDGVIVEHMAKRLPSLKSFEALLEEAFADLSKEEKELRKELFREIVGDYLKQMYNIQRGIDHESDLQQKQDEMKGRLFSELELDEQLFESLNNSERQRKTEQQMQVFEKLLVRDQDKMTVKQREQLFTVLSEQQVTIFDQGLNADAAIAGSDRALEGAEKVLSEQQTEHFQIFQEYHWHAYDMPGMNDIPGMGR